MNQDIIYEIIQQFYIAPEEYNGTTLSHLKTLISVGRLEKIDKPSLVFNCL